METAVGVGGVLYLRLIRWSTSGTLSLPPACHANCDCMMLPLEARGHWPSIDSIECDDTEVLQLRRPVCLHAALSLRLERMGRIPRGNLGCKIKVPVQRSMLLVARQKGSMLSFTNDKKHLCFIMLQAIKLAPPTQRAKRVHARENSSRSTGLCQSGIDVGPPALATGSDSGGH